eukprot:jgi/Botrbrau1/5858/Bobra.0366s0039.1
MGFKRMGVCHPSRRPPNMLGPGVVHELSGGKQASCFRARYRFAAFSIIAASIAARRSFTSSPIEQRPPLIIHKSPIWLYFPPELHLLKAKRRGGTRGTWLCLSGEVTTMVQVLGQEAEKDARLSRNSSRAYATNTPLPQCQLKLGAGAFGEAQEAGPSFCAPVKRQMNDIINVHTCTAADIIWTITNSV